MNKGTILYLVSIICWILLSIDTVYLLKHVLNSTVYTATSQDISLVFSGILLFIIFLGCFGTALTITEKEYMKSKKNKLLQENEDYYNKMQNMDSKGDI